MEKVNILIVEDESYIALEIENAIRQMGYNVCGQISTCEILVSEVERIRPDLILMDTSLNGEMDGIEAAGIIREYYDIPVVYLMDHWDEDTCRRAKKTMPLGYIQKPFEKGNLRGVLETALYTSRIEHEYKKTSRRLVASEQRYQDIFNSMVHGFAVHEMLFDEDDKPCDYRFLSVNTAFELITGFKSEDVCGRTLMELLPEVEKKWIETYGRVVMTGEPIRFSDHSVALDKYFDVSAYRVGVNLFACSFVDITERIKTEQVLVRQSKINFALAGISTRLISAVSDVRSFADVILGQALEITQSQIGYATITKQRESRAACYFSECSKGDARESQSLGNNTEAIETTFPEELKMCTLPHPGFSNRLETPITIEPLVGGQVAVTSYLSVPIYLENKISGHILLLNCEYEYSDGDLKAVEQIGELYTLAIQRHHIDRERDKLHEQMRRMHKMEAIGALAGGVAHDFNNILQPIMGYANMILKNLDPSDKNHKFVNSIFRASMRARDLVQQILTFSRGSEQELQPVDPRLITKEAIRLLRSSLPSTIEIRQKLTKECGMIMADPTKYHQVVMNLATNAFHALQDTGGIIEICLESVHLASKDLPEKNLIPGDFIHFEIADDGMGMDRAVQAKIFDPYFTTKEQAKGTGLGLSVVMGIVKSYKGFITVESEPGVGTTFHVYLPRASDEHVMENSRDELLVVPGDESILLVDDEPAIIDMLKSMLEGYGYNVTEKRNSKDALELFQQQPNAFDLVVTDMTMPNMTGVELSRKILHDVPQMPIILCTGYSELIDEEKAELIGIRKMLFKPVSMVQLGQAVRDVLDAR